MWTKSKLVVVSAHALTHIHQECLRTDRHRRPKGSIRSRKRRGNQRACTIVKSNLCPGRANARIVHDPPNNSRESTLNLHTRNVSATVGGNRVRTSIRRNCRQESRRRDCQNRSRSVRAPAARWNNDGIPRRRLPTPKPELQLIARLQVIEINRLGRVRRQCRFWPNAGRRRGCRRSIGGSRRPTTATAAASNDEPGE